MPFLYEKVPLKARALPTLTFSYARCLLISTTITIYLKGVFFVNKVYPPDSGFKLLSDLW